MSMSNGGLIGVLWKKVDTYLESSLFYREFVLSVSYDLFFTLLTGTTDEDESQFSCDQVHTAFYSLFSFLFLFFSFSP